jgi:hypothetical protein
MKIDLTNTFAAKGIDVIVSLTVIGDSVVLAWSDGVANDYEETYGSLSVALARLATLSFCGEGDDPWSECFKHDEDGWTRVAADWLETVVY